MRIIPYLVLLASCAEEHASELAVARTPVPLWTVPAAAGPIFAEATIVLPDGRVLTPAVSPDRALDAVISEVRVDLDGSITTQPWAFGRGTPYGTLQHTDGDGDGQADVVLVSSNGVLTLTVFDPLTAAVRRTVELVDAISFSPVAFELFQNDADPLPEVLVSSFGTASIHDDDGTQLTIAPDANDPPQIVDVDDDGLPEVLMTDGRLLELPTLGLARVLPDAPWGWMKTADWNADGVPDTLALRSDRQDAIRLLWDGASRRVAWVRPDIVDAFGAVPFDIDRDGTPEILPVHGESTFDAIDPATGRSRTLSTAPEPWSTIEGLLPWDHDLDGIPSLLAMDAFGARLVDPDSGWGPLKPGLIRRSALLTADVSGDGVPEVIAFNKEILRSNPAFTVDVQTGAISQPFLSPEFGHHTNVALDWDGDGDDEIATIDVFDTHILGVQGGPVWVTDDARLAAVARVAGREGLIVERRDEVLAFTSAGLAWRVPTQAIALAAGDLDQDGTDEVIFSTPTDVVVLDAATGAFESRTPATFITHIGVLYGAGAPRLVLSNDRGDDIQCWELVGGSFVERWSRYNMPLTFGSKVVGANIFFNEGGWMRIEDADGVYLQQVDVEVADIHEDVLEIPGGFVTRSEIGEITAWPSP